ncbi:FHA domain-containing protein [Vibrio sp. SCSIO 43135]|uniref:type VI secretion system-associated FHA domain protein n=1 Tax=Vibrio sp. SCSIO 43135 TaxID=2819096 RepID=UPI0020764E15|nr:FHA domain-containing protein [Vibrio sp. SCSIO 43135]USD39934.1 FHA domain-containing protein [Vibrio sp. SCSIO 43135]
MAISVHLISVPAEEVVTSRVVYLPENGGEFGRSPSCDIALPDQSKRISRVHGKIVLKNNAYFVKDTSNNGVLLNDKPLAKEREYPLNDGDVLKIESYTMLVSTLTSTTNVTETSTATDDDPFSEGFSLDLNDEMDFLEDSKPIEVDKEPAQFSKQNVLSDDPFSADPFEDLDQDKVVPNIEIDEVESIDTNGNSSKELEYLPVHTEQNNSHIEASIDKLIHLTEKNQRFLQNPQLQHEALFNALEQTVEQFLNEFAPTNLESQFSEYVSSGMFTSKDKKYWRIYRKHFQHRRDNGDFRRQFKALFMENMQKQGEEQ